MNVNTIRPIRFSRLEPGSRFMIFAEPTRTPPIRKSNDQTVYHKNCEAYSTDITNEEHVAILYPDDLVRPLSRPKKSK